MKTLTVCPSTLQPGFDTYSPTALKSLFDGEKGHRFLCGQERHREGSEDHR